MSEVKVPEATIYDLGYKRYIGKRKPQATRWWVVSRQVIAHAMKSWWRMKLWIGFAILITVVISAIMIAFRTDTFKNVGDLEPVSLVVDRIVADSIIWYTKCAFLLSLTVGVGIIAADRRSGAFTFYFSRPVRPIDYLIGKWVGLFLLQAIVVAAPLFILAVVRVGVSRNQTELLKNLEYLPKALLVGTLAASTYASVTLAFSSMMENPRVNIAIWAVVYLIGISIPGAIAAQNGHFDVQAIDFPSALWSMSRSIYNMSLEMGENHAGKKMYLPSTTASVIGLSVWTLAGLGFAYYRVREVAYRGIGGG